jgi:hypothetical protein
MSRITAVFDKLRQQKRKALIPFITAGDPEPAMMISLMHELVKAGQISSNWAFLFPTPWRMGLPFSGLRSGL